MSEPSPDPVPRADDEAVPPCRGSGRSRPHLAALALLALPAMACGEGEADRTDGGEATGEILVSAAASLTDAFGELARTFEAAHPGAEVTLNLAGSSTLRTQILEGAPADVFASADTRTMDRVVEAGAVAGEPRLFARNRLRIAVPRGNPGGVSGLSDLARDELLVGLCARDVPCGALAREALARAGVTPAVDTEEPDVRALLIKVALGELDAAVTYATDVEASDAVEGVDIPPDQNVEAAYPIAVLAGAPNPELAQAFVAWVLSPDAGVILRHYGFTPP